MQHYFLNFLTRLFFGISHMFCLTVSFLQMKCSLTGFPDVLNLVKELLNQVHQVNVLCSNPTPSEKNKIIYNE